MRFLLLLVKLSILAVATVYAQAPELVRHFALAQAGVVSLLTDGPVARPGYVTDDTLLNEKVAAHSVQQVVDFRRGVDLLLARRMSIRIGWLLLVTATQSSRNSNHFPAR